MIQLERITTSSVEAVGYDPLGQDDSSDHVICTFSIGTTTGANTGQLNRH